MRSGLIALNPKAAENASFKNFCAQIHKFQERGALKKVDIVSLIHPNFFPYPSEVYFAQKNTLIHDVEKSLAEGVGKKLSYNEIRVLEPPFSGDDDIVGYLSNLAFEKRDSVVIVGVDSKQKLYKWFVGGLPETAALSAPIPVLLIKIDQDCLTDRNEPQVVLAIDVEKPPSMRALRRFSRLVRPLEATVHVVAVIRKSNMVASLMGLQGADQETETILQNTLKRLESLRLHGQTHVLEEKESVAATISEFSQQYGAWITAVTSPHRDIRHRLMWGSTTQALISESSCPLLVLRAP